MNFGEFAKALVACGGAVATAIGALQTESAASGESVQPVAYIVAGILAIGTGLVTYIQSNTPTVEPEPEPEPQYDRPRPQYDPPRYEPPRYEAPLPHKPPAPPGDYYPPGASR